MFTIVLSIFCVCVYIYVKSEDINNLLYCVCVCVGIVDLKIWTISFCSWCTKQARTSPKQGPSEIVSSNIYVDGPNKDLSFLFLCMLFMNVRCHSLLSSVFCLPGPKRWWLFGVLHNASVFASVFACTDVRELEKVCERAVCLCVCITVYWLHLTKREVLTISSINRYTQKKVNRKIRGCQITTRGPDPAS